ncbi:MAG: MaoC family dehydratase [Candidatus Hodarchaeales archaeon]|jgi:3-hydroxybutyryl-CoA dehydratase
MKSRNFTDVAIGESAEVTRTISEADIEKFAEVSGDNNPIHLDEDYARNTFFKGRIAHGALTTAFFSKLVAMDLLGSGTILLSNAFHFKKPVRINDTITARIEVIKKHDDNKRLTLKATCENQDEEMVVEGEVVVMLMKQ